MHTTRDSIRDVWGARTPHSGDWPVRVDERTTATPERWVQGACTLCSNGCALDIGVRDNRIVGVRGRADDVVNRGRLGPKGLYGWEAVHSSDRLTRPLIRRGGRLEPATWDEAMDLLVHTSRTIRERYTGGAIGFYTSGQLFLEEYYTLCLIGHVGLDTPHMDGNTRLCTATAGQALKETFGSDGQPGAYEDIDVTDCIVHVGHNLSNTDTVLWMRVLDRRASPNPPTLIVIDPRRTETAAAADIHLAPREGSNVALLNGLLHLLIAGGFADRAFLERHTVGFDHLERTVAKYPPTTVEAITGVPAAQLQAAADAIGRSRMLLSTCLQGVFQSNQATAAAVQVNNLNLVLGRIGRPGCGILQMNGQPTAQNTRETGADGDLSGFRNWDNPRHVAQLARLWNVDERSIPNWGPPTHALQIFRYCETGSIRMLWISATNPAVSMPDLPRIRKILAKRDLFLVVQDAFLTETAQFADVVLPAAIWGEKTGCATNVNRVVHLMHKAVEPPGEARSDLDIFLDYARRMDFRDRDGAPLIKWHNAEEAFAAWAESTRGRPCDYTGLSHAKLTGGSGIPWPCNAEHPEGTVRLYTDLQFPTHAEVCETYGHDIETGAAFSEEQFRAMETNGRAILRSADYIPPPEQPDDAYPFYLTTGRLTYHFHTRTRTGKAPELSAAAPDAYVQINTDDAARLGIREGDFVRVTSRRATVEEPARVGDIEAGHVFIPFHYGYWDKPGRARAANELTLFGWDPVSKQPFFKFAAVKLERVERPTTSEPVMRPDDEGTATIEKKHAAVGVTERDKTRHRIGEWLARCDEAEGRLITALRRLQANHPDDADIPPQCSLLISWSERSRKTLATWAEKFAATSGVEAQAMRGFAKDPSSPLLLDLQAVWLAANESCIAITVLEQAAKARQDPAFHTAMAEMRSHNERQRAWIMTEIKGAAPQTLVVPH